MYRTHETLVGIFSSPTEYKEHLRGLGYEDLGWQNGWDTEDQDQWTTHKLNAYRANHSIEDLQWNRTGSHCTYVIHALKVFCSVDMGD